MVCVRGVSVISKHEIFLFRRNVTTFRNNGKDDVEPVDTLIVVELDPQLLVQAALLYHVSLQRVFKVDRRQHLD